MLTQRLALGKQLSWLSPKNNPLHIVKSRSRHPLDAQLCLDCLVHIRAAPGATGCRPVLALLSP